MAAGSRRVVVQDRDTEQLQTCGHYTIAGSRHQLQQPLLPSSHPATTAPGHKRLAANMASQSRLAVANPPILRSVFIALIFYRGKHRLTFSSLPKSHIYVLPHATYYVPPTLTVLSQNPFSNEAKRTINLRQLQSLKHPCANSYDPHAPSIRNNLHARVKSPEHILLEPADHQNKQAIKATLSEHRRQQRKTHTRRTLADPHH
jgi:hypothetical protein